MTENEKIETLKALIANKTKDLNSYKERFMQVALTVTPVSDRVELIAMFGACLQISDEINELNREAVFS